MLCNIIKIKKIIQKYLYYLLKKLEKYYWLRVRSKWYKLIKEEFKMFLENINGPEDIKKLKIEELPVLVDETRKALINKISNVGGHNGPNLGMLEMTVAMHYVFNSPIAFKARRL